jgi:hypothetical protein
MRKGDKIIVRVFNQQAFKQLKGWSVKRRFSKVYSLYP